MRAGGKGAGLRTPLLCAGLRGARGGGSRPPQSRAAAGSRLQPARSSPPVPAPPRSPAAPQPFWQALRSARPALAALPPGPALNAAGRGGPGGGGRGAIDGAGRAS